MIRSKAETGFAPYLDLRWRRSLVMIPTRRSDDSMTRQKGTSNLPVDAEGSSFMASAEERERLMEVFP